MTDDAAFLESGEQPAQRAHVRNLRLPLNDNGTIDWESAQEKHKEAFIEAVKADPNGILQNIQEEAGSSPAAGDNPTGIADVTVLAGANLIMVVEAILISTLGAKIAPPLKNVHPVVAIKACTVTMEEIQPIMEPGKRIIKRYVPDKYLSQEWQDIAVCCQELAKLSIVKFKECVKLGIEIQVQMEQMRNAPPVPTNGAASVM